MSQTEVHRQKIARLFALLDVDGDGRVDGDDYTALAGRIAGVFGHTVGSVTESRLRSVLRKLWHIVHDHPKLDRNGVMTLPEMQADHVRDILHSPLGPDVVRPLSLALLQVVDPTGKGTVAVEDLARLLALGFGVPEDEIGRLAGSAGPVLRYQDVHRLVREFFFSGDPSAPGSILLGPLDAGVRA